MADGMPREQAEAIVADYLEERLTLAGDPAGLKDAVVARLVEQGPAALERSRGQAKYLRARSTDRPPVYYGYEEASEDALQRVAAGARAALAATGQIVDPIPFERQLADALRPTMSWSLRGEASRVPRPSIRPDSLGWSEEPAPWRNASAGTWPPADVQALEGYHQFTEAEVARCGEAPYEDWVQVALMERHHTFPDQYTGTDGTQLLIAAGLELSDGTVLGRGFPLSHTRPDLWTRHHADVVSGLTVARAGAELVGRAMPLATTLSFDQELGVPNPGRGAGLHPMLLGPGVELVALLNLRPEDPAMRMILVDDDGPAMVCRTWDGFLVHDGSFEPPEPAVVGTDLLLRPDLYQRVVAAAGRDRVVQGLSVTIWQGDEGGA